MGRLAYIKQDDRFLPEDSQNRGSSVNALDPKYGGQQGWAPNVAQFVSNQAHKSSQLICVMIEAPNFFKYVKGGQKYIETLKAVMEVHSMSITGFTETLTVDTDQHAVGGAGAMQQEVVNVTREQPTPTHAFVDKYGRPIQKLLEFWIRYGLMDPDSKHPLAPIVGDNSIQDMGPDMYSMTCLYFEPNVTFTGINRAWLVTNMYPTTTGDSNSERNLTSGSTILNLDIPFTGLAQVGYGVNKLALKILRDIRTLNADNYYREAFAKGIDPWVGTNRNSPYVRSVEETGKEAVTPTPMN